MEIEKGVGAEAGAEAGAGNSDCTNQYDFQKIWQETKWDAKLPIEKIDADPGYIRSETHHDEVQTLTESISAAGAICQPVLVYKNGDRYILVNGHKRLGAANRLEHDSVPAIILPDDVRGSSILELITNMAWHKVNHLKIAMVFKKLKINEELFGKLLGLSKSSISELLGLCRIPDDVAMDIIHRNSLSKRQLIQLSRTGSEEKIRAAYEHYKQNGKLPERPRRGYNGKNELDNVLIQLENLQQKIVNLSSEFYTPDVIQNMRRVFAALDRTIASKEGSDQFDASIKLAAESNGQSDAPN